MTYVECFVVPVPEAKRAIYEAAARTMADVYMDLGALRVVEVWPDDVSEGEVTSFPRSVLLEEGEASVVAWIEYPDKATRDACNAGLMDHPKVKAMTEPVPIDGKRMIFGGFVPFLDVRS
ncbi:MAG: DUF1428 domain-containing protein [Pseudomonadota bacterium]